MISVICLRVTPIKSVINVRTKIDGLESWEIADCCKKCTYFSQKEGSAVCYCNSPGIHAVLHTYLSSTYVYASANMDDEVLCVYSHPKLSILANDWLFEEDRT